MLPLSENARQGSWGCRFRVALCCRLPGILHSEAHLIQPVLTARYALLGLLGEGGSGRVFRVRDSLRDRDLALKLVTAAERRFLRREFESLRQVRHENLIQVFDWGTLVSDEAYYTMELIQGEDWGRRMGTARAPEEVRRVLTGLMRGLAHLHSHGEIHGDLKPGNILLGSAGIVKVTDVGMGGTDGEREGAPGTPGYAAPEIWEGAKAQIRSDLYSVGVMAYEALTGTHPFAGKTIRDVIAGQIAGWVPTPASHGVRIPADLERVVMRALERDPALRQGSADEFMEGMGVEDTVGEVLGGRFVDRDSELKRLLAAYNEGSPARPTLVRIVGPPGIGATRLISEFIDRAVSETAQVERLQELARALPVDEGTIAAADRVSLLANSYLKRGEASQVIVLFDEDTDPGSRDSQHVDAVARYLKAVAGESGKAVPVIFITTASESIAHQQEHTFELVLQPLTRVAHDELVRGYLGKTSLSRPAMERLFSESGGNPGACHSLLLDLVTRGVLARSDGVWTEKPAGAIQALQFAPSTNPLSGALRLIQGDSLDLLVCLCLVRKGITAKDLSVVIRPGDLDGLLYRLSMKGWVRHEGDRWLLMSGAVKSGVLDVAGTRRIRGVTSRLRALPETALDAAARLEVDLAARNTDGLVRRAIALSRAAIKRGSAGTAVRWLQGALAVEDMTTTNGDRFEASVLLAEALLEVGEYERAVAVVSPFEKVTSGTPSRRLAERELVRGRALRALGRVGESRQAIERARSLADRENLLDLELESESTLAGIEWELGDEATRAAAIDRVSRLLVRVPAVEDLVDERAALAYNLGAAMIRAGRYSDARGVLSQATAGNPSQYWRMRIRNASSIADYRLGNFDSAMKQIDEAWQLAEDIGADSFRPRILTNRGGYLYGLGRPREAAESNRQGARWAQRFGDSFEYLIGCAGAAICMTVMGRYEEGLEQARATEKAAGAIGDTRHLARGLEVQAIIHYYLGATNEAQRLLSGARAAYQGHEYVDLGPRLDWLGARLDAARGDRQRAITELQRIEAALRELPDLEDLWGVQVELNLLTAEENPASKLSLLAGIVRDARKSNVLVVEVAALAAIGEILMEHSFEERDFVELLSNGLARAEEQGMLEASWQLSYWLGRIALRAGNRKVVQSRYGHAIRVLREISGALTAEHSRCYLSSPKVGAALQQMNAT